MSSLNYLGTEPESEPSNPNNDLLVLNTTKAKNIVDNFSVTRGKTLGLIQSGWSDGTGFIGSLNYLAGSNPTGSQQTLQNILSYKNGSFNPCIQSSAVTSELNKYIPYAKVGVAGGVASTDSNNRVPVAQLPSMGSGYLIGPLGISNTWSGQATTVNSGAGPLKFAEWAIQTNAINFQPMVFMVVNALTDNLLGRSVIEVRISSGPANSYSTMNPLVAMGTGKSYYTGTQTINVLPCATSSGQNGFSSYPPTYNTYLTAWLYDVGIGTSRIENVGNAIISASAFLMRVLAS